MKIRQKAAIYAAIALFSLLPWMHAKPLAEPRRGGEEQNVKIKSAIVRDSKITWVRHYDTSGKLIPSRTTVSYGAASEHPAIVNYQTKGEISGENIPLSLDSTAKSMEVRTYLVKIGISLNQGNIQQAVSSVADEVVLAGGRAVTQSTIMGFGGTSFSDSLKFWMVKTFTDVDEYGKPIGSTVVGMLIPFTTLYAMPLQGNTQGLTAATAPMPVSRQPEYDSTNTRTGDVETSYSFAFGEYGQGMVPQKPGFEITELTEVRGVEKPAGLQVSVYPNPSSRQFTVSVESQKPAQLKVFGIDGKEISSVNVLPGNRDVKTLVPAPGTYVVILTDGMRIEKTIAVVLGK